MAKSQLETILRSFSRRLHRHKALSNSDLASFAANFHSTQKSFAHAVVRFHVFVTVFPRRLLMSSHDLLSNSTAYFDVQRPCPQFTSSF